MVGPTLRISFIPYSNYVSKLLWDFTVITDSSLQHNHPDITMVLKQTNEVYLLDISIPGDSRLSLEKQTKYVGLKIEVAGVWKCRKATIHSYNCWGVKFYTKRPIITFRESTFAISLIQTFQRLCMFYHIIAKAILTIWLMFLFIILCASHSWLAKFYMLIYTLGWVRLFCTCFIIIKIKKGVGSQ